MNRDNAPGTLDEELHEEACCREGTFAVGEDPRRDESHAYEGSDDDCSAAAKPLGDVADYCAADAGTGFHDDGGPTSGGVAEFFLGEHEGCVAVLGGVGVV